MRRSRTLSAGQLDQSAALPHSPPVTRRSFALRVPEHMKGTRMTMNPRISLITLGVKDVAKSVEFYMRLGFTKSAQGNESVGFFQLHGGSVLALYGRTDLARDCGLEETGVGFGGITLAHNAGSAAEVDRLAQAFEVAGARILKEPHQVFWGGYIAYAADPDGHIWEIAHNPAWKLDETGGLKLPD